MVEEHLVARGIRCPRTLQAFRQTPREEFVPLEKRHQAYADSPLPIGEGQTISQPYIVALMAEALRSESGDRILEIGTGSGYAAAVLSHMVSHVYTIERLPNLARGAEARLKRLGYDKVSVRCGDGTLGWPEEAPFEGIVVAAGGPTMPESLSSQLTVGGRLVIPVGDGGNQHLVCRRRVAEDRFEEEDLGRVRFVPLIGEEGW